MRNQTTQTLYAYWNEVRVDRLAPNRFDIEPGRIAGILPETMIIERNPDGNYRFRLAGTRLCEHFGGRLRGSRLFDVFQGDDGLLVARNLGVMARQGAVGLFHIQSVNTRGEDVIGELIILPLLHVNKNVDRFLGAWSFDETPADDALLVSHCILDYELLWPRGRPIAPVRPAFDCETAGPALASHVREARVVRSERRHFRVYDGGRTD